MGCERIRRLQDRGEQGLMAASPILASMDNRPGDFLTIPGKPPTLPGDAWSLTVPGVCRSLLSPPPGADLVQRPGLISASGLCRRSIRLCRGHDDGRTKRPGRANGFASGHFEGLTIKPPPWVGVYDFFVKAVCRDRLLRWTQVVRREPADAVHREGYL